MKQLRWLDAILLDSRFGIRMLVKHRGLSVVAVFVRDSPSVPPNLTRQGEPTIYHPVAVGDIHPVVLSVRFAGEVPGGFVNRFREIGAEVDPALQLHRVNPLVDRYNEVRTPWRSLAWAIGLVTVFARAIHQLALGWWSGRCYRRAPSSPVASPRRGPRR